MEINVTKGNFQKDDSYLAWTKLSSKYFLTSGEKNLQEISKEIIIERHSKLKEEAEEKDPEPSFKYNAFNVIAYEGLLTYYYWGLGQEEKYEEAMATVRNHINFCSDQDFVEKEYLDGFSYVLNTFALEIKSLREEVLPMSGEWNRLNSIGSLPVKTQVGIMCMKNYMIDQLELKQNIQIVLLRKMIEMDPKCYEWYLSLLNYLQFRRNNDLDRSELQLDPEELSLIEKAMVLAPTHPRVLLNFCQVLEEVLIAKNVLEESREYPFQFCGLEFTSLLASVGILRVKCEKIVKNYAKSGTAFMKIAKISNSIKTLPFFIRDVKNGNQTEVLLVRNDSEFYHRLGVTRITSNTSSALSHLSKAVQKNEFNYEAIIDHLCLLMAEPVTNTALINKNFHNAIVEKGKKQWGIEIMSKLIFLRACFHQMIGKGEEAVADWFEIQTLTRKDSSLIKLFKNMEQYRIPIFGWNGENLSLENILRTIQLIKISGPLRFEGRAGEFDELVRIVRHSLDNDDT